MIIFFGWMPKIYFFQLPKLNKICLGVELDPAHQVIKKLKMDPNAVFHFMPQRLQDVIKKKNKQTKRACQSLKFWVHALDREINIFKKFHIKIKFWSKVIECMKSEERTFGTPCKQRRFWATHINRKWTFCTLQPWFGTNSWENRLYKSKDT